MKHMKKYTIPILIAGSLARMGCAEKPDMHYNISKQNEVIESIHAVPVETYIGERFEEISAVPVSRLEDFVEKEPVKQTLIAANDNNRYVARAEAEVVDTKGFESLEVLTEPSETETGLVPKLQLDPQHTLGELSIEDNKSAEAYTNVINALNTFYNAIRVEHAPEQSTRSRSDRWKLGVSAKYHYLGLQSGDPLSDVNDELAKQYEDHKPIKQTPHLLDMSLKLGYLFAINEKFGIGPVISGSMFGGVGGRLYENTKPQKLPGTGIEVGETDVTVDGNLDMYLNVAAGVEAYFRPLEWLQINAGARAGVVHMKTSAETNIQFRGEQAIIDLAKTMGQSTEGLVESVTKGTGWNVSLYGGPEFRIGDQLGLFVDGGFTWGEVPLTTESTVYKDGIKTETKKTDTTKNNTGPFFEVGLNVHL